MANRVQGRDTVFRVAGLPPGPTKEEAASIIDQVCERLGAVNSSCHPTVHSLGQDPYCPEQQIEMVATVTFETVPPGLVNERSILVEKEAKFRGEWKLTSLTFDITFLGFTPLNELEADCPRDEIIDCIAVSGLASHAYGSWKSRNGNFMWLRDESTWRKSNVRVMLYGYDTTLVESESFQTIENIGTELGCALTRIRRLSQKQDQVDSKPCPIVFIAHSLGGLVVKEAICKMSLSKEEYQRTTASCVYGLIFFGVPNTGIRIDHWLRIVKGRPNEALVRDLSPGSEYLLELQRRFETQFTYPKSKVLSIFETKMTRTTKFEGGSWQLKGPTEILVEEESAVNPMNEAPESISLSSMQMNQNHADLPKFLHRHDPNYRNLTIELKGFWENAIIDVRSRFISRTSAHRRSSLHPRKEIQAKRDNGHMEPDPSTTRLAMFIALRSINKKRRPEQSSNISTTDPADSTLGLGRLQLDGHSPQRPSSAALPSSREFLQSHASESGDNLARAPSLPDAVFRGSADVVWGLLSKGADVHMKGSSGETLLHTAVGNGHIEIVNLLLAHGADVNATDSRGLTLMHWVPAGRSDIVELLVRLGLKIDVKDGNGNSGLMWAVFNGQAERVRTYLRNGADVNLAEPIPPSLKIFGETACAPILVAVFLGQNDALKALVGHGADLLSTFPEAGGTALHYAAFVHNHDAMNCLILAKIDLEARDKLGGTALHWVAQGCNSPLYDQSVRLLLDAGADIEALDTNGCTPLHWAAFEGHSKFVQTLLDAGADIKAPDTNSCTPLHWAAFKGHSMVVQTLLDAGADIEAPDTNGCTLLHWAVFEGHSKVVQMLLDAGADIEARSVPLRTPLHEAVRTGQLEITQMLLDKGAVINSQDNAGHTALHIACVEGGDKSLGVIKHLLSRGASMLEPANLAGQFPPHYAAAFGFKKPLELFLDMGFDKRSHDSNGLQIIHHAAWNGRVDILELLLEGGTATFIDTRADGYSPVDLAALGGHEEAVSALCKFGANVNIGSPISGRYPIHYAAEKGYNNVMSVLQKKGANLDALDKWDTTALVYAVRSGHISTVSLLLEYGASIHIGGANAVLAAASKGHADIVSILCERGANIQFDTHARTAPLLSAAGKGYIDVIRILLEHGADIEVKSKSQDWTPLHFAARGNHLEIVSLLLEKGANRKALTKDRTTPRGLAREMGHHEVCKILGDSPTKAQSAPGGKASDYTNGKKGAASGKRTRKK